MRFCCKIINIMLYYELNMNKYIKIYKKHIALISGLLDAVSNLTGFSVVWKSANGKAADASLPLRQSLHCNPFCRKIKADEKRIRKCSHNDCVSIVRKAEKLRKPFLNKCHAGVTELIAPLFIDGALDSLIYIGPFRRGRKECIFGFSEYDRLVEYDCRKIEAVKKIIPSLSHFILEKRESFIRSEISEKVVNIKIQTAIGFINSNYRKTFSASDVAEFCGLSVSRFVHLFKEECGIGFADFLRVRRIDEAKKILEAADMKIYDVASRCGFSGQCYFGLVFRKQTGMSPLRYRKKYGKIIGP